MMAHDNWAERYPTRTNISHDYRRRITDENKNFKLSSIDAKSAKLRSDTSWVVRSEIYSKSVQVEAEE